MNTSNPQVNTGSFMKGGLPEMANSMIQTVLNNKIIIVVTIVGFAILGYLIYDQFINKNTVFNANREHSTTDPNSNKTAEMMLFYVDWCPQNQNMKENKLMDTILNSLNITAPQNQLKMMSS